MTSMYDDAAVTAATRTGRKSLMRRRMLAGALTAGMVSLGMLSAPGAQAQPLTARPCSPGLIVGVGSQGTPFALRARYEMINAGQIVVGEEFEINTRVPNQPWTIEFTDNGTVFFSGIETSTGGPIAVVKTDPVTGSAVHTMGAHADNTVTGETIDAAVTLPPPPACH